MKLHTKLDIQAVYDSLTVTKARGLMSDDIHFHQFDEQPSKSHPHGFIIQLGTFDQASGPTNSRHYKNTGTRGASSDEQVWAASYDEWGWFIADIFDRDPNASFGHYKTRALFNEITKGKYRLSELTEPGVWVNVLHP